MKGNFCHFELKGHFVSLEK